jgi:Protein of unknown function (DUF5818)
MRKLLAATAVLLLALGIAWAQQPPSTSDSNDSNSNTPSNAGSEITVRGCLGGSSGNFTLLGSDGTTYQLQGNDDQLKRQVGHTVAVTGTVGTGNSTSSSAAQTNPSGGASAEGTTGEQRTLTVSSLQHISSSCGPSSATGGAKQ